MVGPIYVDVHDELQCALQSYVRFKSKAEYEMYTLPSTTAVTIVDNVDACERAIEDLLKVHTEILGIDTEWSDRSCNVALLQLATPLGGCVLIRMPRLQHIPTGLQKLFLNEQIVKFGVGISQDLLLLEKQFGLQSCSFVDLRSLAARHDLCEPTVGLASICKHVLHCELDKSPHLRQSAWNADLTAQQITYAACDAYVSVDIVMALHKECATSGQSILTWCGDLLNHTPKAGRKKDVCQSQARTDRLSRRCPVAKVPVRTKDLYSGCRLMSPDGIHLANVSIGKAEWYISKGLGSAQPPSTPDEPLTVRLKFRPNGIGHSGDAYYLQDMHNRCVGCGATQQTIRYSVIPPVFRSQMPRRFKEHSSHDIVLLCPVCFTIAVDAAQLRRQKLFNRGWALQFRGTEI